jgi:hypothetical protein
MANIYRVREIERAGQPTGKFRMTEASDESSDSTIFGLCEHEHDTQNEARLCPVVVAKLERIFPPTPACPTCDELTKRIEELERERDHANMVADAGAEKISELKAVIGRIQSNRGDETEVDALCDAALGKDGEGWTTSR